MTGFVDLHCHWVAQIDDGARSVDEGLAMLEGLAKAGFEHVVGTPHMRPGMFDNDRKSIEKGYRAMLEHVEDARRAGGRALPSVSLGSEHFFDVDVVGAICDGGGLPYSDEPTPGGGKAILVEFQDLSPTSVVERQLFMLQTRGFIPVIAHPERYRTVWSDPESLGRLVDLGSVALLDICALTGKYGERAQSCSRTLLERGLYDAACTDSHRPTDVEQAADAIEWLERHYGGQEVDFMLRETPRRLLEGLRPES